MVKVGVEPTYAQFSPCAGGVLPRHRHATIGTQRLPLLHAAHPFAESLESSLWWSQRQPPALPGPSRLTRALRLDPLASLLAARPEKPEHHCPSELWISGVGHLGVTVRPGTGAPRRQVPPWPSATESGGRPCASACHGLSGSCCTATPSRLGATVWVPPVARGWNDTHPSSSLLQQETLMGARSLTSPRTPWTFSFRVRNRELKISEFKGGLGNGSGLEPPTSRSQPGALPFELPLRKWFREVSETFAPEIAGLSRISRRRCV